MINNCLVHRFFKLTLFIILLSCSNTLAQEWVWVKKLGFSSNIVSSATDEDGNTYVLGNYATVHSNFIAKFNAQGNVIWSSAFNGNSLDRQYYVRKIKVDKDQKVYVLGFFELSVNFGNGINLSIPSSINPYGISTGFLCVYSKEGLPLWAKIGSALDISEEGKIYTRYMVGDDGFSSKGQLSDYLSKVNGDSVYRYNSNGQIEFKIKVEELSSGYSGDMYASTYGQDLWILNYLAPVFSSQATGNIEIFEYKNPNTKFVISKLPIFSSYKIYKDAIYFLGWFVPSGDGTATFGDIVLQSPSNDTYKTGGFFAKFNLVSKKFEWAKVIKNVGFGFNNFLTARSDVLYLTTEACCGSLNDLTCYSTKGDSLWTQNFYTSGFNISEYNGIGTDKNGNVYAAGTVSNGYRNTATFGNLSFPYDGMVGFVAKIGYPIPTQPKNLVGQAISTSSIKLTWEDSNNETSYRIEYRQEGQSTYATLTSVSANIREYTVTNLICSKMYSFRIMAIGNGNSSDYSNELSLKPLNISAPKISYNSLQGCKGQQIALEAPQGFLQYLWSSGESSQKINVSLTGEYSVQVKDGYDCESSWSDKLKVSIYDYPDSAVTILNNEIVYLGIAESFKWYFDNSILLGENKNKIKPTQSGVYRLEATSNGCTSVSKNVTFTVTGLEAPVDNQIDIYPIPASRHLTIKFGDKLNSQSTISLFDLSGKVILENNKSPFENIISLETDQIKPGVYLIQVNISGEVLHRKVIIN